MLCSEDMIQYNKKFDELVISVRSKQKFVVLDIERYNRDKSKRTRYGVYRDDRDFREQSLSSLFAASLFP